LWAKADEQVERTCHLIRILPEDRLDWRPPVADAWPVSVLLGHLLECLAGFCAVLYAAAPDRLAHFQQLRGFRVNHGCGKNEALERIAVYRDRVKEGFGVLRDGDLCRALPTVFVADGESVLTLLLGNLEHLINHKHQLFSYLKMMGVNVGSEDLYRFRS
jgi:hypothetical protein